jgi:hypothetical protein
MVVNATIKAGQRAGGRPGQFEAGHRTLPPRPPLNLEATNATRSPLRRTDRYPNLSWRNFRLIGTQPFNLADHVDVAGRRREDVEAQRLGWTSLRCCRAFRSSSRRRSRGRGNPSRSSSFKRRDWMTSGFIGCCRARKSRAPLSNGQAHSKSMRFKSSISSDNVPSAVTRP